MDRTAHDLAAYDWSMAQPNPPGEPMRQCPRCECFTRASANVECRWCQPAPDVSAALAEHTATALDILAPR